MVCPKKSDWINSCGKSLARKPTSELPYVHCEIKHTKLYPWSKLHGNCGVFDVISGCTSLGMPFTNFPRPQARMCFATSLPMLIA